VIKYNVCVGRRSIAKYEPLRALSQAKPNRRANRSASGFQHLITVVAEHAPTTLILISDNISSGNTMAARITSTPDILGGKPCIAGHRIRVSDIAIWYEHQGLSADEIVSQLPTLTLAEVHAALAYYYENIDSIRQEIRAELEAAKRYKGDGESLVEAKLRQAQRVGRSDLFVFTRMSTSLPLSSRDFEGEESMCPVPPRQD
jgi:uncharacterized protein (DUF433 family)